MTAYQFENQEITFVHCHIPAIVDLIVFFRTVVGGLNAPLGNMRYIWVGLQYLRAMSIL